MTKSLDEHHNPWQKKGSRDIYENEWLTLREDSVIRPDGRSGIYSVVELGQGSAIMALDGTAKLHLVGQWRYCIDQFSWEIPAGGCAPGEQPLEAARRELLEEAGLVANVWRPLGSIHTSNSCTTNLMHLFLAQDLTQLESKPEPTELLISKWVSLNDALNLIERGTITDAPTIVAILKTVRMLKEPVISNGVLHTHCT